MDVVIKEVVADVGGGSFHTLDEDFSSGHIKVVVEELTCVFGLPEEIFGNVSPELCRTKRDGSESNSLYAQAYLFNKSDKSVSHIKKAIYNHASTLTKNKWQMVDLTNA